MKLIFHSKRVNIAVLLGEQPDIDEDEYVHNDGGSFETVGCNCSSEADDAEVRFGFSPVKA